MISQTHQELIKISKHIKTMKESIRKCTSIEETRERKKEEKIVINKEKEGTRICGRAELQYHRQAAIR